MAQSVMEDESSRNHGRIMSEAERLSGQEHEKAGRSEARELRLKKEMKVR